MDWMELKIYTAEAGIEPLSGILINLGINGFVVQDSADFEAFLADKTGNWDYIDDDLMGLKNCETSLTVYLPENAQGAEMYDELKNSLSRLKAEDKDGLMGRLEIESANVREEDWANNWKQYFKPLTVGNKLVIKPSWEEYRGDDGRTILEIDPASSFGTGQHNTTQLCLEMLEEYMNSSDVLLDMGCGSGILSIAAMLLGAKEVTAVDIDENSVRIAAENADKNHIAAEKYRTLCGNVIADLKLREKIGSGYDIITANIVADVLIGMSSLFTGFLKPDGILIMSGIISERRDEVVAAAKAQGFLPLDEKEKDGWVAVTMKNGGR